jgi:hypothetical protein
MYGLKIGFLFSTFYRLNPTRPQAEEILSDLISIQIPALVLYYSGGGCGVMMSQKSTGIRFKKVVFETFYG